MWNQLVARTFITTVRVRFTGHWQLLSLYHIGDGLMNMEHWWNNAVGKMLSILRKPVHCLSVHHRSHMRTRTVQGLTLGLRGERPAIDCLIRDSPIPVTMPVGRAKKLAMWFAKASILAFVSISELTATSDHLPVCC